MKLGRKIRTAIGAFNLHVVAAGLALAMSAIADAQTQRQTIPANEFADPSNSSIPASITITGVEFTEPLFDEVNGSLWVRGKTYKAQFNADGVTYIPFLGSDAPRNYPVRLSIASMSVGATAIEIQPASPVREGNQITFNRGAVREVYHIGLESIEQTFVFDQKPGAGDLHVQLNVNSDLAMEDASQVIRFSNDLGGVTYSKAIAVDAKQSRTEAATSLDNGHIRITVPRDRVASAQYPLVIDPILGTFAVTTGGTCRRPDVAYEAGSDTYFVVWQDAFSETDNDIYGRRFTRLGIFLSQTTIDTTTDNWRSPKVASNRVAQNYLVVAERDLTPNRKIYGRIVAANTGVADAQFPIMTQFDVNSPDVGGDPHTASPTYYLVTYSLPLVSVRVARLESSGTVVSEAPVAQGLGYEDISISKSNGNAPFQTQAWTIVWRQGSINSFIWAAQYSWNGAVKHDPFVIADSNNLNVPKVSTIANEDIPGGERKFTVVHERNGQVWARTYRGATELASANLTQLENVNPELAHVNPVVESFSSSILVANRETDFGGTWKTYLSGYCMSPTPYRVAEQHRFLADTANSTSLNMKSVGLASVKAAGGSFNEFMTVWVTPDLKINAGIGFAKPNCCPSDVNSDGATNVSDLLIVINAWGTCTTCAADINGDTSVNVSDLLAVINGWGPCL